MHSSSQLVFLLLRCVSRLCFNIDGFACLFVISLYSESTDIPEPKPIWDIIVQPSEPADGDQLTDATVEPGPAVDMEFPSFCRSPKERECWTLFRKMAKKGE